MTQGRHDQMLLIAFLQAANCSNYPASWRHPATQPGFLTPDYYQHIARTLEARKFHLAFCDDRLALPGQYGDAFAAAIQAWHSCRQAGCGPHCHSHDPGI